MPAAVIDLLGPESTTLSVAKAWVDCGLARPLAWTRLDVAAQWELLDARPDRPDDLVEMGEILNHLGGRADLHVVVLGDTTSADDAARLGQLSALLDRIARDFGPSRPPTTLMLAIPHQPNGSTVHRYPTGLIELQHWDQVLMVSPEDTPDPNKGNELGDRPLDSLVAHALFGLCNGWSVDAIATPERRVADVPGAQVGRLIRAWSRVIDAGFVVDQLATEIMRLPARDTTPAARRVDTAFNSIVASDVVKADLEASPPQPPPQRPKFLRYLLGFLVFALRNVVPVVAAALLERVLRPLQRMLTRLVKWGLKLIGAKSNNTDPPLPPLETPPVPVHPVEKARNLLRDLDAGVELADAPPANESLLRYITDEVVASIDKRELSVDEAVGFETGGAAVTLMGRLIDRYRSALPSARAQVEEVAARFGQQLEPQTEEADDPEQAEKTERRMRRRRRLRRIFASLLFVVAVAASVVGLVVPGMALLGLVPLVLGVGWVVNLLRKLLLRLGEMYNRQFGTVDSDEYRERQLDYLVALCIRRTYRVAQLQHWTRVIRAMAEGVAAGAELPALEQRPFTPVYAPRSMSIATGVTQRDQIVSLASKVRASHDSPLYKPVWSAVLRGRQEAFEETRRLPRNGAMADLLAMEVRGLPADARAIGRSVVTAALRGVTVDEVLRGVIPWVRQRESHGVERLDSRPGVEPPGPAGRAVVETSVELGLHSVGDCMVLVGPGGADAVGFGVVLAGDGRIVVTANAVLEGLGSIAVNGVSVDEEPLRDGLLAAIRHETGQDGVALGGLSALRLGRPLFAPGVDGGQQVTQRCTIAAIDGEVFTVDLDLRLGTPLVDATSGTLLGIVTATAPTRAVGPVALQRLMAAVSLAELTRHDDELDTGLWIPLDVQMGGAMHAAEPIRGEENRWPTIPGSGFLDAVAADSELFLPLLTNDTSILRVDDSTDSVAPARPSAAKLSVWMDGDGRLLLTSHRIQMSNRFDMKLLYATPDEPPVGPGGERPVGL